MPEDPTARESLDEREGRAEPDEPDGSAAEGEPDRPSDADMPDEPDGEMAPDPGHDLGHDPGAETGPDRVPDTDLVADEPPLDADSATVEPYADPELGPAAEAAVDDVEPQGDLLEGALAAPGAGTLRVPLSPVAADRIRWVTVAATVVGAMALLVADTSGYASTLVVTLVLALVVAWGWPVLSGSYTPDASTGVLAASAVAIVLGALRDDLRWVAAAVAFGIVLSFAAQLLRRTGREGLVLTLMSSFGGLAVIASGATGVIAANSDRGTAVAVVAMSAVAAAVVPDLLAGVRAAAPLLGILALFAGALAGVLVGAAFDAVGPLTALGIGAAVGTLSWSFRRVLALEPAMTTVRGQLGAGAGSVVAMGAVVHLFAVLG